MKKIKVILGTAVLVSLLGFSSFAAITTTPKGVQKLDGADIVDALNNNADVLDNHIDKIATSDILGHIKIGTGLQVSEDGTANVKIANDLVTDDTETALSAAKGKELSELISILEVELGYEAKTFTAEDNIGNVSYNAWRQGKTYFVNGNFFLKSGSVAPLTYFTLGTIDVTPNTEGKYSYYPITLQNGEAGHCRVDSNGLVECQFAVKVNAKVGINVNINIPIN